MRNVRHPHLISCRDYIKSNSHVYLVMEYCSMGDLNGYIKNTYQSQGMPEDIVLHFLGQLASGLKYLHDQNLIHRDIKPKNIFLVPPPTTTATNVPDVKLGDFGLAKALPKTSLAMSVLGSPIYMAPEVLKGEPYNYKADLWSLGVVLYELMTGHTLFRSTDMENLRTTVDAYKDSIPFKEGKYVYSSELKDLTKVLLKRCPDDRASCEEFCHYVKLISQKDQHKGVTGAVNSLIDSNEFQKIEEEYIVIECEPPPSSSIISPTPPLIPNIQRSHSVDNYEKKFSPAVRDRRHSAGANASMLTKAISMAPFNLFGAYRSTATEKVPEPSSSSSTIAEESIVEEDDIVKYLSDNINHNTTSLNIRLFEITNCLIKLYNNLVQPDQIYASKQSLSEESIALVRKIIFLLNKVVVIKVSPRYTDEERDLLRWASEEMNKFTVVQSNYKRTEIDQRVIQRLLYDNAVEMSREAAVSQLVGEDLFNCKAKYEESILLLEAVLILPPHQHVKRKDVAIIENLIQSLKSRSQKISPDILSTQKEIETLKL
ncbi:Serine/threonine-protein kinase, variant 2 [Mucor circinelloides]